MGATSAACGKRGARPGQAQQPGAGATACRREQSGPLNVRSRRGRGHTSTGFQLDLPSLPYRHSYTSPPRSPLSRRRTWHRDRSGRRRAASRAEQHPPFRRWPTRAVMAPYQPEEQAILCAPLLRLADTSSRHLLSIPRRNTMPRGIDLCYRCLPPPPPPPPLQRLRVHQRLALIQKQRKCHVSPRRLPLRLQVITPNPATCNISLAALLLLSLRPCRLMASTTAAAEGRAYPQPPLGGLALETSIHVLPLRPKSQVGTDALQALPRLHTSPTLPLDSLNLTTTQSGSQEHPWRLALPLPPLL